MWLRFNRFFINHISLSACQANICVWLISTSYYMGSSAICWMLACTVRGLQQTPIVSTMHNYCLFVYVQMSPPPLPPPPPKLFTGLLQILFLAGATQHPIQQHCAQSHEVYELQLPPCACCESFRELLHIMWVRFDDDTLHTCGTQPNHIIPLLPTNKEGTRFLSTSVVNKESQTSFQVLLK